METEKLIEYINHFDEKISQRNKFETKREEIFARTIKLTEEVGELATEILATANFQRQDKMEKHSIQSLEEEFADVIITTMTLAKKMDINIIKALENKCEKVKQRFNEHSS